jgi:hypothetical protein
MTRETQAERIYSSDENGILEYYKQLCKDRLEELEDERLPEHLIA